MTLVKTGSLGSPSGRTFASKESSRLKHVFAYSKGLTMSFKMRRLVCISVFLLAALFIVVVVALDYYGYNVPAVAYFVAFAAASLSILLLFLLYRCPNCGTLILDGFAGDQGFDLWPDKCRQCGSSLC